MLKMTLDMSYVSKILTRQTSPNWPNLEDFKKDNNS